MAPSEAVKPALLVFITVDQMREDYLERWRGEFIGGFRRLVFGGAFFTNGHQDHAITETAPGHASTMSGRFPRSTGITRNTAGVNDSTWPLLGSPGLGAAPFRMEEIAAARRASGGRQHRRRRERANRSTVHVHARNVRRNRKRRQPRAPAENLGSQQITRQIPLCGCARMVAGKNSVRAALELRTEPAGLKTSTS